MVDLAIDGVAEFVTVVDPVDIDEQLTSFYVITDGVGAWTFTEMANVVGEIISWWSTFIAVLTPATATLSQVRVKDWTVASNPYIAFPAGVVGSDATTHLPWFTPAVVQLYNTTGGTPNRSFVNHGPVRESVVTGNQISIAGVSAIAAAYDELRQALPLMATPAEWVIVSRVLGGANRVPPVYSGVDAVIGRQLLGRRASRQT